MIHWAEQSTTHSDNASKPWSKRARAIFLTLNLALDLAPDLAAYIENSQIFNCFQYTKVVENLNDLKRRIEDKNTTQISRKEVIETLFEYWPTAFQFDLKQLAKSEGEKRKKTRKLPL